MTRSITPAELASLDRLGRLEVTGLQAWAYHGVFADERRDGQVFGVDVAWWLDLSPAAASDDLAQTIDYGQVAHDAIDLVQGEPVDLIETVAELVADGLLARHPMAYVQVSIHKPQAPLAVGFDDVVATTALRTRSASSQPTPTRPVVFSLGSNLEPRWSYLQFAATALITSPSLARVRLSPVYQTVAVGPAQPDFLNAVVLAESNRPARTLLERALTIERLARRRRDIAHGPRTLDIDLIAVGDEVSQEMTLTLPHPRAHQRAFVLRPWSDLDPTAQLSGRPIVDWLAEVGDQGLTRQPDALWQP